MDISFVVFTFAGDRLGRAANLFNADRVDERHGCGRVVYGDTVG